MKILIPIKKTETGTIMIIKGDITSNIDNEFCLISDNTIRIGRTETECPDSIIVYDENGNCHGIFHKENALLYGNYIFWQKKI